MKKFGIHFSPVQQKSQKIVTDEDENRKATAGDPLKKLDEVKNFIKVNERDRLKMIFNELIKNVEQMRLENRKTN